MPEFLYEGKLADGRIVNGVIKASSPAEAAGILRQRKITPTSLRKKGGIFDLKIQIKLPALGGVKTKDLVVFTRQFATMLDAGVSIVQALDILSSQQPNPTFKKILTDVKATVEGGSNFADALAKHPKVFDQLYVNLVAAGEAGGVLDTILNRLAQYMEKVMKLKAEVKSALTYPVAVLTLALLITVGLLVYVVPRFQQIFTELGAELPAPTQMLIKISETMRHRLPLVIGIIVAFVVILRILMRNPRVKYFVHYILLKLPIFGDLIRKVSLARFTRTLATMISSGVSIVDGLEICARIAGNKVVEDAILHSRKEIMGGKNIAEPLGQFPQVFPPMVVQMIAVGEATGAMDTMLTKIADFYDDEVDAAVGALTSMIEPLMMAFLGVLVGGILISLYLPIFSLAGAVGGTK